MAGGNSSIRNFEKWREEAIKVLLDCMQPAPPVAAFDKEVIDIERREGYTVEKILFNVCLLYTSYSFKAFGGDLDYYFMYGPDFYTMIDRYTELTGKSPMLPRFAMGLHAVSYTHLGYWYSAASSAHSG